MEEKDIAFGHGDWYVRANSQVEVDAKLLGICNWSEGEVCARDGKVWESEA